jgi:ribosomal protein S18 acetylase RimI-like enzyme
MLKSTSSLLDQEISWIRVFLKDSPLFLLYFECAIDDLRRQGLDNRSFHIGKNRKGLIQSIAFDGITIATAVGELDESELTALLAFPAQLELHVETDHAAILIPASGPRLKKVSLLQYYRLSLHRSFQRDPRCRWLTEDDFEVVSAFYRKHYPQTVFSKWMLKLPFVGLFEQDELVSSAGVIIAHDGLGSCNLGNFLTAPHSRGKGLARTVAEHLIEELRGRGIQTVLLGTTSDNLAACRAYEKLGFEVFATRPQLDLRPL